MPNRRKTQIPESPPPVIFYLGAKFHRHRAKDERGQKQHEGSVKARENGGVGLRERGEQDSPERNEPHFVTVPQRANRVDGDPPLAVVRRHEGVEDADSKVESIEDRVADQKRTFDEKPDYGQGLPVHLFLPSTRLAGAGRRPRAVSAPNGGGQGPMVDFIPRFTVVRSVSDLLIENVKPRHEQTEVDKTEAD